jgi:hypothetical protein
MAAGLTDKLMDWADAVSMMDNREVMATSPTVGFWRAADRERMIVNARAALFQ